MFVSSIQDLLPYYNTKKRSRNTVLSLSLFFTVSCTNNTSPNSDYSMYTFKALYLQSVRSTGLMYHRYLYGSFAEYSVERTRGKRRGFIINARVVGMSRGNKEKNLFGFEAKDSFCPELRCAKGQAKPTQLEKRVVYSREFSINRY